MDDDSVLEHRVSVLEDYNGKLERCLFDPEKGLVVQFARLKQEMKTNRWWFSLVIPLATSTLTTFLVFMLSKVVP